MILFEDEDETAARIGALEQEILEMIEEAALALGIEPTGWAWKCDNCGENVRPDNNFGHDGGPGLHCGPVGIAPEHARDAWRAVLAAIRGRQGVVEVAGHMIAGANGKAFVPPGEFTPRAYDRGTAEMLARAINSYPEDDVQAAGIPFRVVPVGPVVDLKPFGAGVIDRDGDALTQHTYVALAVAEGVATALNEASPRLSVPLPQAPFAAVPLFYVPPPDRPAEAVEPDPRTERWAAIPKVGKPRVVSGGDPYGDLRPRHCATKIRGDGRVRVACQAPGERPAPRHWRWVLRANFGKAAPGDVPYCAKCAAALLGGETAPL